VGAADLARSVLCSCIAAWHAFPQLLVVGWLFILCVLYAGLINRSRCVRVLTFFQFTALCTRSGGVLYLSHRRSRQCTLSLSPRHCTLLTFVAFHLSLSVGHSENQVS
jgi:hypothetical protein